MSTVKHFQDHAVHKTVSDHSIRKFTRSILFDSCTVIHLVSCICMSIIVVTVECPCMYMYMTLYMHIVHVYTPLLQNLLEEHYLSSSTNPSDRSAPSFDLLSKCLSLYVRVCMHHEAEYLEGSEHFIEKMEGVLVWCDRVLIPALNETSSTKYVCLIDCGFRCCYMCVKTENSDLKNNNEIGLLLISTCVTVIASLGLQAFSKFLYVFIFSCHPISFFLASTFKFSL